MTSQQEAQQMLDRWQELRGLPPEERISILMQDFFHPPIALDVRYEDTLRSLSDAMVEDQAVWP